MAQFQAITVIMATLLLCSTCTAYPDEHLPEGNTTVIAVAHTRYAIQAFALGKDNKLWHRYLKNGTEEWSQWTLRPSPPGGDFDGDPVVGVNKDGSIEVFIRYATYLDLWQFYQTDPADPEAFSVAREPSCIDSPQICANSTLTYWNTQPVFPTSDMSVSVDPFDGRLQVFYRGFDGALYRTAQVVPGDPRHYSPPERYDVIYV
jgi:hypothetical protein